ncbi:hypothetical protein BKI52_44585 [marine bacterium AO1-C]|nr:hypothetical protein BKI52_44585 [marine bacterium AO1-C]
MLAFSATGQTKSTLQINLNGYLNFSDKVASQAKSMIRCLATYQKKANRYKRYKSRLSRIYPPRCNIYGIDYQYEKAQKGHIASLNTQVVTMKNVFDKIEQQSINLKNYCTRKTYLTDNFKFSDNTIKRIQQLFQQLQTANEKLKQSVANRARTSLGSSKAYSGLVANMRRILKVEDDFQKKYFINLNDGRYINPTEQQLAANVQKLSESVTALPELERKADDFSLWRYYESFKRSAKRLLSARRKSWDKSLMKNTVYIYRSNTNYAYNMLVKDFNNFVKACKAKRIYFIKHSRVSPGFILKKVISRYNKNPVVVVKTFTDKPTPALSVVKQSRPISPTTLAALNNYIYCMNEAIDRNNSLLSSIKAYNRRMQRVEAYKQDTVNIPTGRRRKIYYPFYFTRNYYYPRSLFFMAEQKSKQLPKAYQTVLNAQLGNIQNILEEIASLGHQLNAYLRKKSYKQDQFARSKQILARYQYLYKVFDAKRNQLYGDILKIKASYPNTNKYSPNSDSEKAIAKALELGLPVMEAANKFMRKESKDLLDKSTATPLVEAFDYTKKVPYSRQKRREWKARRRINTFVRAVKSITNAEGKYRVSSYTIKNLAYNYNYLVDSYNEMAISQGKHQQLMKMQYPQILTFGKVGYIPCDCGDANDEVDMTSMKGYAHNNLMLLLDVSGSMKDELPMLKRAMKYLVKIMRPEDHVSVVVFESRARIMLRPTSAKYQDKILRAIDTLKSRGSTNGEAGIRMAYDILQENYINQGNNRVILVTDGEFTIKPSTFNLISEKAQQDISMSVFSFADQLRSYNKLRKVVKMGQGNYEVISEGNAAYKMVREAQSKKLPGKKRRKRRKSVVKGDKKPCDCNSSSVTEIDPPKVITTTKDSNGVNMTSMKGFAPNNLMLLLDVSGSMASKNKLPLLKTAFKKLVDIMRPEDEVSIVIYAGDASVALKPTSANKPDLIKEVIDKLRAKGKTDVKKGFKLAYKWITKNYKDNGNNRIILATDGEFPMSDYIYKLVRKRAEKGVHLSVFSFGNKNKFDSLQKLVEKGQGNYEHVDESNVQYKLIKEAQSIKAK